jgi:hypothetical protein
METKNSKITADCRIKGYKKATLGLITKVSLSSLCGLQQLITRTLNCLKLWIIEFLQNMFQFTQVTDIQVFKITFSPKFFYFT